MYHYKQVKSGDEHNTYLLLESFGHPVVMCTLDSEEETAIPDVYTTVLEVMFTRPLATIDLHN